MKRLHIAPIIEGHGEQSSVPHLLRRIWHELLQCETGLNVLRPIRISRSKLVKPSEMIRATDIAATNLKHVSTSDPAFILVLFDADDDLPCVLAPRLLDEIRRERATYDVALVIANVEYETWFVAAAESLASFFEPNAMSSIPDDPEAKRAGKGWVQRFALAARYAEPLEQPRMTAKLDLQLCRSRSRSFDKLCRELEARC